MGNQLCAPWRKGYRDEDHQWTPRKDSHLLRLWAEIFEVQEENGDICWGRVSDDVVPVNITCVQNQPTTVFQITAYNRHVEKIFDVRIIQPGTRITQASECFVHWKDSKCDHEWGLNFTTPADARCFRDCCMSPVNHNYSRKAASSGSLRTASPKRAVGSRKSASNPTSPVAQPRRAVSSPEELAVQEAIEAGFIVSRGGTNDIDHYSEVSAIATAPRIHRQSQPRTTPHVQNVFSTGEAGELNSTLQQQHACENLYSQVTRPTSSQTRHDDPPTYATAAAACAPSTMHLPIAERAIPYEQYMSHTSEQIYSTCRVTPRTTNVQQGTGLQQDRAPGTMLQDRPPTDLSAVERLYTSRGADEVPASNGQELRQFSREPTIISFTRVLGSDDDKLPTISGADDGYTADDNKSMQSSNETVSITAGFDSNTLKRMLQTLPEVSSPVDHRRQFEEEFADIIERTDLRPILQSLYAPPSPQDKLDDGDSPTMEDINSVVNGILRSVEFTRTERRSIISSRSEPAASKDCHMSLEPAERLDRDLPQRVEQNSSQCIDRQVSQHRDREPAQQTDKELERQETSSVETSNQLPETMEINNAVTPIDAGEPAVVKNWNNVDSVNGGFEDQVHNGINSMMTASSNQQQQQQQQQQRQQQQLVTRTTDTTNKFQQFMLSDTTEAETATESETLPVESNIYFLPYEPQAAFASKSTAIRKTGWLSVQNWLLHKMVSIVAAPSPTWNRYWVCLKGTTMLFYMREQTSLGGQNDRNPRNTLVISGSIAHVFPDCNQLENVFALSTAFGDAYLMQAESATEMDSWIEAVHMTCAASYARHLGRDGTVKLLRAEIHKLENSIDLDLKMKKMAGMQTHMANDPASRQALERQMITWDENLEKLHMEQFQLRCYLAALHGTDMPSNKALVSSMSKSTRAMLSSLGVGVAVSAFHALVSARTPLTMTGTICQAGRSQGQGSMSTFKADTAFKLRPRSPRPFSAITIGPTGRLSDDDNNDDKPMSVSDDKLVTVYLPDNQSIMASISERTTVQDLLEFVCSCCHLNPSVYFIRFNLPTPTGASENFKIPDKTCLVLNEEYLSIELCAKLLFQTELVRTRRDQEFGFSIEAKVSDSSLQDDELCVIVSDVAKGGPVALKKGLQVGDELLVLNGLVISQLDMVYVETLIDELDAISLTVRSCRSVERPVCPASRVGPAGVSDETDVTTAAAAAAAAAASAGVTSQPLPMWLQHPDALDSVSMSNGHTQNSDGTSSDAPRTLSDSQRICKIITELIETERQYVRDVMCLIDWYLEPLKAETFLSGEDIERLFGNIQEIVQFQKQFLHSLEQAVEQEAPPTSDSTDSARFKKVLFSIGSAFLYYAHHFKLYSSFCASHSKAQKVLLTDSNIALQEFLRSRNPNQQHSATLESFLIKPIQRILKYPLLLRQLTELTDTSSDEHAHLREALHGMEAVAEHINEMQKIYEEYGNTFDELSKQYKDSYPHLKGIDLNVGELQMYGTVNWLNASEELGKLKKGTELLTLLFIFKTGVVLMAQERAKGKRKGRPVSGRPSSQGTDSPDTARYKTAIPVDQLQVRTMVSDAHECHGIWEMVWCASETDYRPEKVFQFASSQEARRDFIRTIHHTVRENVQRATAPGTALATDSLHQTSMMSSTPCNNTATTPAAAAATVSAVASSRRPESLATNPYVRDPGAARYSRTLGSRHSMEVDTSTQPLPASVDALVGDQSRTRCHTLADFSRSTLAEQSSNQQQLGSQSTLASDRGAGGARLLHTSHDPTHYSTQTVQRDPSQLGSPIWKRRNTGRAGASSQSPASNDDTHSDGSNSEVTAPTTKQRVTFRIPPSAYIETEDTDC